MTLTVSKKSLFGIPAITISWIIALATWRMFDDAHSFNQPLDN